MATNPIGQDMTGWAWAVDPTTFDKGGAMQYRMNTYDPKTGTWSNGSDMTQWSRYGNLIAPQISDYLRSIGYTGNLHDLVADTVWKNANDPIGNANERGREAQSARNDAAINGWKPDTTGVWDPNAGRNTELDDWLAQKGYSLQNVVGKIPGATQTNWVQRNVDEKGNPLAIDWHNDRFGGSDRADLAMKAAVLALTGYGGYQALTGPGVGATAGSGASTLGAGATGAGAGGLTTQGLGSAAELLGGLTSNSAWFNPLALAPELGTMTAGLGSASELLGGLSSESTLFNPLSQAPGWGELANIAPLASTPASMEGSLKDLLDAKDLGKLSLDIPGLPSIPLDGISKGIGSIGSVSDLIKGGIGAIGAYQSYKDAKQPVDTGYNKPMGTGVTAKRTVTQGRYGPVAQTTFHAEGGQVESPRYISGPGDGVSDSIPAQIDGHAPAQIASGEFIFPARVVSALGNGSSEAGAAFLEEVAHKIMQDSYGTTDRAFQIDPSAYFGGEK